MMPDADEIKPRDSSAEEVDFGSGDSPAITPAHDPFADGVPSAKGPDSEADVELVEEDSPEIPEEVISYWAEEKRTVPGTAADRADLPDDGVDEAKTPLREAGQAAENLKAAVVGFAATLRPCDWLILFGVALAVLVSPFLTQAVAPALILTFWNVVFMAGTGVALYLIFKAYVSSSGNRFKAFVLLSGDGILLSVLSLLCLVVFSFALGSDKYRLMPFEWKAAWFLTFLTGFVAAIVISAGAVSAMYREFRAVQKENVGEPAENVDNDTENDAETSVAETDLTESRDD